nr:type II toxin-antitoxin system RelE/ParE family toxin [uncultured Thalassospira sp.]|tara:strand:- start:524 stop:739 length:216 start_codon:yes stop_codon:yes gene_type:complete
MAVNARYRLTPRAEADLEDIWRYTHRRWSVTQADKYSEIFWGCFLSWLHQSASGRNAMCETAISKSRLGRM